MLPPFTRMILVIPSGSVNGGSEMKMTALPSVSRRCVGCWLRTGRAVSVAIRLVTLKSAKPRLQPSVTGFRNNGLNPLLEAFVSFPDDTIVWKLLQVPPKAERDQDAWRRGRQQPAEHPECWISFPKRERREQVAFRCHREYNRAQACSTAASKIAALARDNALLRRFPQSKVNR